jgi:hypothetical protein
MTDDLDRLLAAQALAPPQGFAQRVTALARTIPQGNSRPRPLRPWQWASLGAGAGLGAFLLGEFALFAFIAGAAH